MSHSFASFWDGQPFLSVNKKSNYPFYFHMSGSALPQQDFFSFPAAKGQNNSESRHVNNCAVQKPCSFKKQTFISELWSHNWEKESHLFPYIFIIRKTNISDRMEFKYTPTPIPFTYTNTHKHPFTLTLDPIPTRLGWHQRLTISSSVHWMISCSSLETFPACFPELVRHATSLDFSLH